MLFNCYMCLIIGITDFCYIADLKKQPDLKFALGLFYLYCYCIINIFIAKYPSLFRELSQLCIIGVLFTFTSDQTRCSHLVYDQTYSVACLCLLLYKTDMYRNWNVFGHKLNMHICTQTYVYISILSESNQAVFESALHSAIFLMSLIVLYSHRNGILNN